MDIRKIESVCSVAAYRSYSEAAYRTSSSPSVISKHIAAVEEELGIRIFKRATKSAPVELTEAGEKIIGYLHEALRQYELARSAAAAIRSEQKEQLTVGYVQQIGSFRENSILADYTLENPDVIVLRRTFSFQELANQVINDTVDAVFLPVLDGTDGPGSDFDRLKNENYVLTEVMRINHLTIGVPSGHPLAGCGVIPADALPSLQRATYLFPAADSFLPPLVSRNLGLQDTVRIRYADFSEKILPCALVDSGAGLLPQICIVPETLGGIHFIPLAAPRCPITLYLVFKKSTAGPALRRLHQYVLRSSAQYYRDFPFVTVPEGR